MFVLIGLGNPGKRYLNTRHNIGYLVVDQLAAIDNIPFKAGKGDYYYTEFAHHGERILLVKPSTYMNRSGVAVRHVLNYFPVLEQDILIVYDDFNLPYGTIRFRPQGSDGGHNGIRSVIYELQTDSFDRLRFGIGDDFHDAVRHVLAVFAKQELEDLNKLVDISRQGIELWIENSIDETMNNFNRSYLEDNSNQ